MPEEKPANPTQGSSTIRNSTPPNPKPTTSERPVPDLKSTINELNDKTPVEIFTSK